MKAKIVLWTVLSLIGLLLIALPDKGPRVMTFSTAHGPGIVDFIGILFVSPDG